MTTLWRIHIRPKEVNADEAVLHCLEQGVIGLGWQVDGPTPRTVEAYFERSEAESEYGSVPAAVRRLATETEVGDLIWFRDLSGNYYVAEVTGPWRYADDAESKRLDIVNVLPANITHAGTIESVPGKVIACFRPRGPFQRIRDDTALAVTLKIVGKATNQSGDLFSMLGDKDTEDLVLIYLQFKGWITPAEYAQVRYAGL